MALTRTAPVGPGPVGPAPPTGPPPRLSDASPTSQALAALTVLVTCLAVGLRFDAATAGAAAAFALGVGIVAGLGADLRRIYRTIPGLALALATFALLSVGWVVLFTRAGAAPPYALVPLAAVAVLGADWWWVERLRPVTVLSGLGLVPLLEADAGEALVLAVLWFGLAAATLWSLRRDATAALPTPVALGSATGPDDSGARTAIGVVAAWVVAALVIALISALAFSPRTPGLDGPDVGGRLPSGAGGGSGGGSGSGSGGLQVTPGGGIDTDGDGIPDTGRDLDGDGRADPDLDGDGLPDDRGFADSDGDGIPDVGRDLDGDGIAEPDLDGDGVPDAMSGDGGARGGEGSATTTAEGSADPRASDPDATTNPPDPDDPTDEGGADWLGLLGTLLALVALAAVIGLVAWAVQRHLARRRALAARPWPIRLAERLDREGARRGRPRRRDEPVTRYADALGGEALRDDRLASVGVALSAALFGARPVSEAEGAWAVQVVDEAVAANPAPSALDRIRGRGRGRARPS